MKKKVAVILCGSGYLDGSEIREAVGTLWALSQHSNVVDVQCFAPDSAQADVMNCLTSQPVKGETRNQLVESARIARGKVAPLTQLNPREFDGVIMPGGFGAAKNLCNFALAGSKGVVCAELFAVLEPMYTAKKPIGAVCIAPAILALAFKGEKLELTVGADGEAAQEITKLGHRHVVCKPDACVVDKAHRIVTTPAYMYDNAPLHEIFTGIQKLTQEVVSLL
ncbi:MAG: isoprenoid biosynthesis glyoxalase ElbB [Deltaproteobacteria bacterium]|nr:isoprenoid biosynthesis glyoxalase ElbB [Deltaproteobacteria bacterium]